MYPFFFYISTKALNTFEISQLLCTVCKLSRRYHLTEMSLFGNKIGVNCHALVLCSEVVMKLTIFEAVLLLDVLKHAALLQPCSVENRLATVLRQAHLLKPIHHLTAEETVQPGHHSTPGTKKNKNKKKRSAVGLLL